MQNGTVLVIIEKLYNVSLAVKANIELKHYVVQYGRGWSGFSQLHSKHASWYMCTPHEGAFCL